MLNKKTLTVTLGLVFLIGLLGLSVWASVSSPAQEPGMAQNAKFQYPMKTSADDSYAPMVGSVIELPNAKRDFDSQSITVLQDQPLQACPNAKRLVAYSGT